jgi:hypothetical protein
MRAKTKIRNYNFSCIYSSDGPGEIERNRERRIIESQRRAVIGVMSSFSDAQSNGKYISARANTLGVYFFLASRAARMQQQQTRHIAMRAAGLRRGRLK